MIPQDCNEDKIVGVVPENTTRAPDRYCELLYLLGNTYILINKKINFICYGMGKIANK